ncbi:unnamed protein product [Menidia menidia]|uniref:(Atlantic silverside) hypothetical protein n=1 Tax=Menidia menidia TaxID=238744 RepID=A0A8S4BVW1_9TELE|nr:unnamed protein product [Menidia menidia]
MCGIYWFIAVWMCSAPPQLLVGLRVGLQMAQAANCSRWGSPSEKGLFEDGDVIIGGLFSLRYSPPDKNHDFIQLPENRPCTGLQNLPLQYIYAMVFALEEINHSSTLLPGLKLGYRIHDSCALPAWALQAALSLVGGGASTCKTTDGKEEHINEKEGGQPVPLIIGGSSSVAANILSRILEPMSVPLVSYTASCPCLSDKKQYPNFFRTMASDIYQAHAITKLAIRYKWTWIGAVIANNDYGQMAVKVFQEGIQGAGVCLAFIETLERENIVRDAKRAALTIKASTAKVILIFTWYTDVMELFQQLAKTNVTDRQFLASEAWSTSTDLLQNVVSHKVARGVLGLAIRSAAVPGFENYLRNLNPSLHPDDEFLREFWEKEFGCTPVEAARSSNNSLPQHRSLHKASLPPCKGTETLEEVQNLFTDTSQLRVTYNVYLAVYAAAHALHSLLSCPDRESPSGNNISTCSFPKQIKPFEGISQQFFLGSTRCDRCPSEFWSNSERTECIPRQLDFLSFNETLGIALSAVAISGATLTTAVFVVFLLYRHTPVVRANNSELSFLLLMSLKLCFLCSLVFIGRPSVWSCRFQQAAFGISFVLSVSCLQVKTIVVLAAFRSARPGAETLMKWFGPGQQRGSVCLFTCVQVWYFPLEVVTCINMIEITGAVLLSV